MEGIHGKHMVLSSEGNIWSTHVCNTSSLFAYATTPTLELAEFDLLHKFNLNRQVVQSHIELHMVFGHCIKSHGI
jgi:hypothetical protein